MFGRDEGVAMPDEPGVDFAVVAYREEGRWEAAPLPPRLVTGLDALVAVLRQQPSESGSIGMVSYDDDYFILARVFGEDVRLLLSDVTAATESELAREVVEALGLPLPEGDDLDQVQPAGDLGLLADVGVSAMDLGALCGELDLYPDEILADIATRLGFSEQFDAAVDAAVR
jgi:putative tRNA adenosine deaminase-associated protein